MSSFYQSQNEELQEKLDELMDSNRVHIETFKSGKYTDEIRMVYYDLLSMNVSIENCSKVVSTVLENLAKVSVDRLPQKSVCSMLMVESKILAQMQACEAMAEGTRNTLHFDGTKMKFEELASYQVQTESGTYSLGIQEMSDGSALCYLDTFRDVLSDMAALLAESDQTVTSKVSQLVMSIKNVMTDRHVVNRSFVDQLTKWREVVLPLAAENAENLSETERAKLVDINHVFCGLHVVHNMGVQAEAAMKEWLSLILLTDSHGGFHTSNSRVYDMLFEISKLCSYTHGDQRNGRASHWRAYLQKLKKSNHIISFLHHRFNVYFVLGGAVYFHRSHLLEFLQKNMKSDNFLLKSVLEDIGKKVYLAGFRALGMFNKLISGPLWRVIEQVDHIFTLNSTWLNLKNVLDDLSRDASPFFKAETLLPETELSKDEVFDELFADSGDVELDALTQECLEIMCCCAVLVNRQLEDQLPGENFTTTVKPPTGNSQTRKQLILCLNEILPK